MKKMFIYEPAMCCETGLCGVGVDPELLRISTVLGTLKKNGIEVKRYNLSNAPNEFVLNKEVNALMMQEGVEILPVTVLDGKIVKRGKYPTNEEITALLELPADMLGQTQRPQRSQGGCCGGSGCC